MKENKCIYIFKARI